MVIATFVSGCFSTTTVPLLEAAKWNGNQPATGKDGDLIALADVSEVEPIAPFGSRYVHIPGAIVLAPWTDQSPPVDVTVTGPLRVYIAQRVELSGPRRSLALDSTAVSRLRVRRYDSGKTAGLAVGLTLGGALAIAVTALAVVAASALKSSFGGGRSFAVATFSQKRP